MSLRASKPPSWISGESKLARTADFVFVQKWLGAIAAEQQRFHNKRGRINTRQTSCALSNKNNKIIERWIDRNGQFS